MCKIVHLKWYMLCSTKTNIYDDVNWLKFAIRASIAKKCGILGWNVFSCNYHERKYINHNHTLSLIDMSDDLQRCRDICAGYTVYALTANLH